MGKTNWQRVFLGGLVAAIVAIVLGFAAWKFLLVQVHAMETLGLLARSSGRFIILGTVIFLIAGIIAIWTYSAIRSDGRGLKAVLTAGITFWILSVLLPYVSFGFLGMAPTTKPVVDNLTGLIICVVATLAGALVYKDP